MKKTVLKEYKELQNEFEAAHLKESTERVWELFDKTLKTLDFDSAKAFQMHLNGKPVSEIAKFFSIEETEVLTWLQKIKKQVISKLKTHVSVRN